MQCGKWCVYHNSKGLTSACTNCSYYIEGNKSRFELGKIDPFKLARLFKEKEEKEKYKEPNTIKNKCEVTLEMCPSCGEKSWWFNPYTNKHECLNSKCPTNGLSDYLVSNLRHSSPSDYQSESKYYAKSKLDNPMLLSVKMFLADIIYIINRKYTEGHVCADFAQEVFDAATERNIRCGYVVIHFAETHIGHAIIAFETDFGLKYFEPQNANEEYITIGKRYSARLEGVPLNNVVNKIEITWNDGAKTVIDE